MNLFPNVKALRAHCAIRLQLDPNISKIPKALQ